MNHRLGQEARSSVTSVCVGCRDSVKSCACPENAVLKQDLASSGWDIENI